MNLLDNYIESLGYGDGPGFGARWGSGFGDGGDGPGFGARWGDGFGDGEQDSVGYGDGSNFGFGDGEGESLSPDSFEPFKIRESL